jgi:uncharacterized protein (TIGR03435 family)
MFRLLSVFLLPCAAALAQTAAGPSFEVASVKLVAEPKIPVQIPEMQRCSGGPGSKTPGKFECKEVSLRSLLARVCDVPPMRVTGPDWVGSARYAVAVQLDPKTTPEEFRRMLEKLLTERFSLRFHRETRSTPVYLLTVAKNGPKLTPARRAPKSADDDKAAVQAAMQKSMQEMRARMAAGDARSMSTFAMDGTVAKFAASLGNRIDREVLDRTGLEGEYDFSLMWTPDDHATTEPSLFAALQEQLGLKIQGAKEDLEFVVIDRAEKIPTEN